MGSGTAASGGNSINSQGPLRALECAENDGAHRTASESRRELRGGPCGPLSVATIERSDVNPQGGCRVLVAPPLADFPHGPQPTPSARAAPAHCHSVRAQKARRDKAATATHLVRPTKRVPQRKPAWRPLQRPAASTPSIRQTHLQIDCDTSHCQGDVIDLGKVGQAIVEVYEPGTGNAGGGRHVGRPHAPRGAAASAYAS